MALGRPTRQGIGRKVKIILIKGVTDTQITPAAVHAADAPATPGNEQLDSHPWGERGCTLPGAAIDSAPGLFDFRHACIHHDGCYQGFDRMGDSVVINRVRCDELFRVDLTASCAYLHGTSRNWRPRECDSTADAYYEVARSFGRTYHAGTGDGS